MFESDLEKYAYTLPLVGGPLALRIPWNKQGGSEEEEWKTSAFSGRERSQTALLPLRHIFLVSCSYHSSFHFLPSSFLRLLLLFPLPTSTHTILSSSIKSPNSYFFGFCLHSPPYVVSHLLHPLPSVAFIHLNLFCYPSSSLLLISFSWPSFVYRYIPSLLSHILFFLNIIFPLYLYFL